MTESTTSSTSPADATGGTSIELSIEGMHCGSCSSLVEESLAEQAGVLSATVDLDGARASVRYDAAQVDEKQLCSVVAEAGYRASVAESS